MSSLADCMPYTLAFPEALGTGLLVQSTGPCERAAIKACIDGYERVLSRFREDSLVASMREARCGGSFDFPDWTLRLFELYDRLGDATDGAIDPCVGEDLIRLGYDAAYSFVMQTDAGERLGALRGRPTWRCDVERHGTTLLTKRPVSLDFGACGKGYLVDLIAAMVRSVSAQFVIDAGGDLFIHSPNVPIAIALEDPADPARAVGTASVTSGAFCASAPSRRHWGEAAGHRLHHLLNAIDGRPADQVAATWAYVAADRPARHGRNDRNTTAHNGETGGSFAQSSETGVSPSGMTAFESIPTALADGLATALFVTQPQQLRAHFAFDCALLTAARHARASAGFPGNFFVS